MEAEAETEALAVKVKGFTIGDFVSMAIDDLANKSTALPTQSEEHIVRGAHRDEKAPPLPHGRRRGIPFPHPAGRYLKRRRDQRIRLATQIGSKLSGVLYVLDEPTIGLHSKDWRNW